MNKAQSVIYEDLFGAADDIFEYLNNTMDFNTMSTKVEQWKRKDTVNVLYRDSAQNL